MRSAILLAVLSACNAAVPTMSIEVPERLRAAQAAEDLVGWVWVFPAATAPESPLSDPLGERLELLATEEHPLDNLTAGETRTVRIELPPDDYWVQVWFADNRNNGGDLERLPLLAFASTAAMRVSQNEMREVSTADAAVFVATEGFDRDGDGQSNIDEIQSGTDPLVQSSRSCGVGDAHCQPVTVSDGPFGALPQNTPLQMTAVPGPHHTVAFTHGGDDSAQHRLSLVRAYVVPGPATEYQLLASRDHAIVDLVATDEESAVWWNEAGVSSIFAAAYNVPATEHFVAYVPNELELSSTDLFWSAWDDSDGFGLTPLYSDATAGGPSSVSPVFVEPETPITGQPAHQELLLRTGGDALYVWVNGMFEAYQTASAALIGRTNSQAQVVDFVAAPPNVIALELTVLSRYEVSMTPISRVEMVSDATISPPLAQDRDNVYWLSGEGRTKVRFLAKASSAPRTEADDSYNVVEVPSGIRAFATSDDGGATRELYLIDGAGRLLRMFL